jgi:hypothetical protein
MKKQLIAGISLHHLLFIQRTRGRLSPDRLSKKLDIHPGVYKAVEDGDEIGKGVRAKIEEYLKGMIKETVTAYEVFRAWRNESTITTRFISSKIGIAETNLYNKLISGRLSTKQKKKLEDLSGGVVKVEMWDVD